MVKTEMKKSINNFWFIASLIVAVCISLSSAVYVINNYIETTQFEVSYYEAGSSNPDLAMITLFNSWIGQEWNSFAQSLFYLLLPFLATITYAWSLGSEIKSGYIKHIVSRTARKKYYLSKYSAVFVSGAIVTAIPLILNFMAVSLFIPAIKPDVFYDIYYGMLPHIAFSELFFTHPFIFVFYRIFSASVFAGLFAVFGMSLSFFIKNKIVVVAAPFLVSLAVSYISGCHYLPYVISPVNFLHSGGDAYPTSISVMILIAAIMFIFSFGITFLYGEKKDVF